jgi:hypothetical protein
MCPISTLFSSSHKSAYLADEGDDGRDETNDDYHVGGEEVAIS